VIDNIVFIAESRAKPYGWTFVAKSAGTGQVVDKTG
jgi:hypothetical protein